MKHPQIRPAGMVAPQLEEPAQLPTSVHDTNDLDTLDWAVLGIGVQFVQHQVGAFHQHAGGGCDLRTAWTHAREPRQQADTALDGCIDALGSIGILQADGDIAVQERPRISSRSSISPLKSLIQAGPSRSVLDQRSIKGWLIDGASMSLQTGNISFTRTA